MRKTNKIIYTVTLAILALSAINSLPGVKRVRALDLGPENNLGGKITDSHNCLCDFITIITIDDSAEAGGQFSKPFTLVNDAVSLTHIYDYGLVDPGRNVLGMDYSIILLPCMDLTLIPLPPFVKCDQSKDYKGVYPLIEKIGTDQPSGS